MASTSTVSRRGRSSPTSPHGRLKNKADREALEAQSLMGRIALPEEIKGLALYLASPASSYVTGAQMTIDGGSSLRG